MKSRLSVFIITFLLISYILIAQLCDTNKGVLAKTVTELESEIKALETKYNAAKNQAESLSRDIGLIDNNISLKIAQIEKANLQIEQKEKELSVLKEDIGLLEVRLSRLNVNIDQQKLILEKRIRQIYIENQKSLIEKIISIKSSGDFLAKLEYMQRIQTEDKSMLDKMSITKDNYKDQKDLLSEKKSQVETIKKEIESVKKNAEGLKNDLEADKQNKENLLTVTKNNESKYKALMAEARKELDQIQRAINIVIREGKGVDVKSGEVIGTMGNSGYSSGAHLHFGVYNYKESNFESISSWGWYYSNYVNPLEVLKSTGVNWATGCRRDPKGIVASGKGKWQWPMANIRITQNFGSNTCYNWMYGGKIHPALDMVGTGNTSIKAVNDGKAYFCRNCLKDGGNGVFIFHKDSKMSVYWHLK